VTLLKIERTQVAVGLFRKKLDFLFDENKEKLQEMPT
jgi:hypothetical protein